MLGFVVGAISLIALIKVLRRGRHHRYYRGGRNFMLRRLFQRLNTGPGQEKVVLTEIDALQDTARGLRDELKSTRADIASILRDENYDKAKVETLFRKQDELLAKMRTAAASSMEKIHGVLDERQKQDLAEMVERGFRRFSYGHHYGHGC